MINQFAKILDPKKILAIQNIQYSEKLLLEDTVPAGSSELGKVAISSLGHFYCQYMTGHFNTLSVQSAETVDDGLDHLRAKLSDGSNQRQLFNDYIPLDLFLSPGRRKDSTAINFVIDDAAALLAAPSNNLFYPQPFQYLFTVNSEILFDVKNDSDVDCSYSVVFHGIRLPVASRERLKKLAGKI